MSEVKKPRIGRVDIVIDDDTVKLPYNAVGGIGELIREFVPAGTVRFKFIAKTDHASIDIGEKLSCQCGMEVFNTSDCLNKVTKAITDIVNLRESDRKHTLIVMTNDTRYQKYMARAACAGLTVVLICDQRYDLRDFMNNKLWNKCIDIECYFPRKKRSRSPVRSAKKSEKKHDVEKRITSKSKRRRVEEPVDANASSASVLHKSKNEPVDEPIKTAISPAKPDDVKLVVKPVRAKPVVKPVVKPVDQQDTKDKSAAIALIESVVKLEAKSPFAPEFISLSNFGSASSAFDPSLSTPESFSLASFGSSFSWPANSSTGQTFQFPGSSGSANPSDSFGVSTSASTGTSISSSTDLAKPFAPSDGKSKSFGRYYDNLYFEDKVGTLGKQQLCNAYLFGYCGIKNCPKIHKCVRCRVISNDYNCKNCKNLCANGVTCKFGYMCRNGHTEFELNVFAKNDGYGLSQFNTIKCAYTNCSNPSCTYYHDIYDYFCRSCLRRNAGHFMDTCPELVV
ncbi:MAG: hypothetical protein Faunusvirus10_18 [Faunusvirus sp.]|jgi:hypothetical protein|uniref:Uncharacterized protein n=1 Tax=Faunusvirus sp. TaxID=2487766 RepID=A0A3G4ZWU2_9VIRU|nr:MAG: hypothetical protein Faunusvirus10_18 [Faunusvirus sp.]